MYVMENNSNELNDVYNSIFLYILVGDLASIICMSTLIITVGESCIKVMVESFLYPEGIVENDINLQEIKYNSETPDDECCICLENYNKNEKVIILRCKHVYHKVCINKWINPSVNPSEEENRSCPKCRTRL
jgi:hypothetical protein